MKKILLAMMMLICALLSLKAQYTTLNAHSHNDYSKDIPFWLAYYNHFGSIETDIWAINGDLFVARDMADVSPDKTFDALYLQPIVKLVRHNKGKAWYDHPSTFQLLIDLKTSAEPTLSILSEKLKKYPDVFDFKVNGNAVRIVISGNRPELADFEKYPDFILYDGLLTAKYTEQQMKRIYLFSYDLSNFTKWNGEGDLPAGDRIRLQHLVDSVHALSKKIRFWNAPDNKNTWKTFMDIKVDYVNTDHINELAEFLNKGGK